MELYNETTALSSHTTDAESSLNVDMIIEQPIDGLTNDCVPTNTVTKNVSETFSWLSNIYATIRVNIGTDQSEESILRVFRNYIIKIRDDMPNCIRLPNRCYILSRNITKMLMLFKSLSNDFADTHEYLINVCELLSIYTTLELRYSTKFEESKIAVANRISTNYDIHLPKMNKKYVLKTLMSVKNIYRQKEIMRKLFEKYLVPKHQNGFQKELNDDEYVMYLINYNLWKCLEDELDEKLKIDIIANSFMKPSNTLRKNFAYAPYIPKFKTKIEQATKNILSQNFKGVSLMKAIEDNWRRHQHSLNMVIDISSDSVNDWNIEDVQMTPLSFPKIKLENPEVIATVDLTVEHSPENDKQLDWLDYLVGKVRATTISGRPREILETIILDDYDYAEEQSETIARCNTDNIDDLSKNCISDEINKSHEPDLGAKSISSELNGRTNCDNVSDGCFDSPSYSNISPVDVPSKLLQCLPKENLTVTEQNVEENSKVRLEDSTNKSEVSGAIKLLDTSSSKGVDSNCKISISNSEKTLEDISRNQEIQQHDKESSESFRDQLMDLQNSFKKDSILLAEKLNKAKYLETVTEPCPSTLGEKNHDDFVCNDPSRFNSNQVKLRRKSEKPNSTNRGFHWNIDFKANINTEEDMESEDNTTNFKRRHLSPVNIKTYSNKHKKSSDKLSVSHAAVAFENNEPDLNSLQSDESVEMPEKGTESEVLIANEASDSMEKHEELNKIDDLSIQKFIGSKNNIGSTDYIMSANIKYPARGSEDHRLEDEDEDYLIKNIAKKLTVHSKKCQTKKRNDVSDVGSIHNTSENTLLDIPVFTSSSDENDDSGESNILSILDESDNSKEDTINFNISRGADSDTHVRKISPKTDICDIKRTNVDNIIFRVSSDNRLSSLSPKKVDVKSFVSNSNVVFSTNISKPVDQNRIDSNVDMGDISGSLNHPEITSPPMEEFTKSDKTLFKTFLKKTNNSTNIAPVESEFDKFLGVDLIPQENNEKNGEQQVVNEQPTTTHKNLENLLFSSNGNRRKTVSFFGVGDEDNTKDCSYNKAPPIVSQNTSKKTILSGKECWTATINTYRSKNQQLLTPSTHNSTVRQINNSTINIEGKGSSPAPVESGKTCNLLLAIKENIYDEKLFNARVYVRRVDKTVYNKLFLCHGNKIKQQVVPKKIDRSLQRKLYSTLPLNLSKKQAKTSIRRSTLQDGSILPNHREKNISDKSDIKLKKKIVVNLLDIAQNPDYRKYFGNVINLKVGVQNETSKNSKEKEGIALLKRGHTEGDGRKCHPNSNVMVNVFHKSKGGELVRRIVDTDNKMSSKHKLKQKEYMSKIRKSNSNIVDLNKAELDHNIVSSSMNPPLELRMSSSIQGVENTKHFNDLVDLEHILNNLKNTTSAKVKFQQHYNPPKKLSTKIKIPAKERNSRFYPKHRVWNCQREMDENQVTSTQDNIPIDTNQAIRFKFPSEVDVQHDFVDTTQNYSQYSPLFLTKDSKNKYDSQDYPTTTTNFENVDRSEEMISHNCRIRDDKIKNTKVNMNSLISIASTCNKVYDANAAMKARKRLSSFSLSRSDLTYKNCVLDMSKTYSNLNSIKTVFVPPEIEKIIEDDGN